MKYDKSRLPNLNRLIKARLQIKTEKTLKIINKIAKTY